MKDLVNETSGEWIDYVALISEYPNGEGEVVFFSCAVGCAEFFLALMFPESAGAFCCF